MSSKSVDMSLDAAKYPSPPVDSVEVSVPRPMMWLIGMKFRPIMGRFSVPAMTSSRIHQRRTMFSLCMAPLGAPVLPEV
ncbi:hypothetical protein CCUG60884_04210 [Mycobacteroides salmoniphilum]|uniref:Uncharacterized protein n=1 Tax=Mycobacteroides salmoniphilum TaxID=404941 RepID=A0A4R8SQ38_9MYCO|nr:hypothetical protein CCUG60884_04210 [Mycobacteroides salmoniphilum]